MITGEYAEVFEKLKCFDILQYKSHISSSQYLVSYDLVKKYCKPQSKILDWGAGNGHFSYFLLKQGFNVTGFSIDDEGGFSGYLREKYPEKYSLVTDSKAVSTLPFKDNSFDSVMSIGVLEHVRETGGNEVQSLNEIKRILKPGGVFICSHFPNRFSWIEFMTAHLKSKHHHPYSYTKTDIKNMVNKAGLILLETSTYGILPRLSFGKYQTSFRVTNLFNIVDDLLSYLLSLFCQNHYFVAKRKE